MNYKKWDIKIEEFLSQNLFHGAVLDVWKDKQNIFSKSYGYKDFEKKTLLDNDTQFLVYSMTKPVTVLGFLLLVQNGLVKIDDNLSDYLPDFKEMTYLDENDQVLPCPVSITFRHLLTMTAGFTYHWGRKQTHAEMRVIIKEMQNSDMNLQEFSHRVSKVPLLFIPGTKWEYGMGLDILGAAIEKITNMLFRDYLKKAIFEPLNMTRSDSYITDKTNYAPVYNCSTIQGKNYLKKDENFTFLFQSIFNKTDLTLGGAGLVTTASDYSKFLNVLIDGKLPNNEKFIDNQLLLEMKSDQLKDKPSDMKWINNKEYSYGLGVRVRTKNTLYPITEVGEAGWDGYLGSSAIFDTKNNLTMTLMISSYANDLNKIIETEFFEAFYQGLRE